MPDARTPAVAFVGAGPTTIYTLHALVNHATQACAVTIFEEQPTAGRGTPYRPGWNDPAMLSNIASIEIPALEETLLEWLERQPVSRLLAVGIDPASINDRSFYPRLALGEFFHDQFHAVIARAESCGIEVTIRTRCNVLDVVSEADGMVLTVKARHGDPFNMRFDHVVLATGHQWPAEPEVRPGYFLSPWPASALAKIAPCDIGIRGTSLSAIDAAVALAVAHGEFVEDGTGNLRYAPHRETERFHMTMMSRKGLLPEADFFHPVPYEPLTICTADAIERLIDGPEEDQLDAAFALFKRELTLADPDYTGAMRLADLTLPEFSEAYFADRIDADPFAWAQDNLAEAQRNYTTETTVPWRYAILRMHEVMALLVPYLDQSDFQRFSRYFKPIFVDDYATVPHVSILRMLALHRAGKLDVIAIGDDHRIDGHGPEKGAIVHANGEHMHFTTFIEATGQRPLAARDFPFPSLREEGIVRDAASPDASRPSRGIVVDDLFHPVSEEIPMDQLFCLSLPFLLGRHPFIQGITSSHEMGMVVGEELAAAISRTSDAVEDRDCDPEVVA